MEVPYFIRLLIKSPLLVSTINAKAVNEIDLGEVVYTQLNRNSVELNDFELNSEEYFKSVSIIITRYGTLIDLVSPDFKYYEESAYYFNVHQAGRRVKSANTVVNNDHPAKSKRIGYFELFDGFLQGTVFRSDLYGCKIMLSYNKINRIT